MSVDYVSSWKFVVKCRWIKWWWGQSLCSMDDDRNGTCLLKTNFHESSDSAKLYFCHLVVNVQYHVLLILSPIVTFQLNDLALFPKRILGTQRLFRLVTCSKANERDSKNSLPADDTRTAPDIADSIDWLIESSRPRGRYGQMSKGWQLNCSVPALRMISVAQDGSGIVWASSVRSSCLFTLIISHGWTAGR